MNQETIERHINSLGKTDFDAVIFLVMKKVFNMIPIDIDGKGDGGLDFRFFENDYKKRIGCQKSVVKEQWKSKAFRDAQKAKEYYPITQFYFFTIMHILPLRFIMSKKESSMNLVLLRIV